MGQKIPKELFTVAKKRYRLNSFRLTQLREEIKLSVEQFADLAGWTVPYQYKLESSAPQIVQTISEKIMGEICEVFARKNYKTIIDCWKSIQYYTVAGLVLKQKRESLKLTRAEFAEKIGWTSSYQYMLESGNSKSIPQNAALKILNVLK